VFVLTDYQPETSAQVKSMDPKLNGHYDIWCYLPVVATVRFKTTSRSSSPAPPAAAAQGAGGLGARGHARAVAQAARRLPDPPRSAGAWTEASQSKGSPSGARAGRVLRGHEVDVPDFVRLGVLDSAARRRSAIPPSLG